MNDVDPAALMERAAKRAEALEAAKLAALDGDWRLARALAEVCAASVVKKILKPSSSYSMPTLCHALGS